MAGLELRIQLMEVGTGIAGCAFQTIITLKKEMKMNQQCTDCGIYIQMTKYEKAKLCVRCKSDRQSGNAEVRQIFKELQKKNAGIVDNDDWSTQDDPRAATEQLYGKVSKVPNRSGYASASCIADEIL